MDPLTIFGAVTGGIKAAASILKILDWAISSAGKVQDVPEEAQATLRNVGMIHRNLVAFEKVQTKLSSVQQKRLSCIPLEDAKNTFIDCVSSLDDLENVLQPLTDSSLDSLSLSNRLRWIMKDGKIQNLSKRVGNAQSSLGLMLTIMHHESLAEVSSAVSRLAEVTEAIALDVASILLEKRRVSTSEQAPIQLHEVNTDGASTIRPSYHLRPDSAVIPTPDSRRHSTLSAHSVASSASSSDWTPPRFAFEDDLERSIAYRRIPRWSKEDISFRSSIINFHALSFLSNQSLDDISCTSVVALPIFKADISNDRHYTFGDLGTQVLSESLYTIPSTPPVQSLPTLPLIAHNPLSSPVSPPAVPNIVQLAIQDELQLGRSELQKYVIPAKESPAKHTQENLGPPQGIFTPPGTPRWQPIASSLVSMGVNEENEFSLTQLSQLTIDKDDIGLSHHLGGPPCFGVVGTPEFSETFFDRTCSPSEMLRKTRKLQVKLSAGRGYLDFFRCQTCHLSLARIVAAEKRGWSDFEVWCSCAIKLGDATPFKVCPCYEKLQGLGKIENFYGCRNLASTEVQCAGCFNSCAGCLAERKTLSGAPTSRSKKRPSIPWLTRLYERQDSLLFLQAQIIENPGEESASLQLAILDREAARFGAILDSMNLRHFLLDHREYLVQTKKKYDRESPRTGSDLARRKEVLQKLLEVNRRLKEYGKLYDGAVAKLDLGILSDRQSILIKRTHLLRLICQHQLGASLNAVAGLDINTTPREATAYHIMSQWAVFKERLDALKSNGQALRDS